MSAPAPGGSPLSSEPPGPAEPPEGEEAPEWPDSSRSALERPGFFLTVVPAALYVGVVLWGGTLRAGPSTPDGLHGDKLFHFLAFGGMQVVLARAVAFLWPPWGHARVQGVALAGAVAVGGLLELVQSLLPYRSAEGLDLLADALGALMAWAWMRRRAARLTSAP